MFGAESAIRPDSLQRAGALGLLHRLLAMDVEDAEGLEDGGEGEDNTRRNGRYGTFNKDITRRDECRTLEQTEKVVPLKTSETAILVALLLHPLLFVFGTESAIRPDSLQRAGASGLLHQLLVRFGNDVETSAVTEKEQT